MTAHDLARPDPGLDVAGLTSLLGAVADAGGEVDSLHRMAGDWMVWLRVPVVDGVQLGWPADLVLRLLEQIAAKGGAVQDLGARGTDSMACRLLEVTGLGTHPWSVYVRDPWCTVPRAA